MAELDTNVTADVQPETNDTGTETVNPEIARLKAALDKATKEAGDYKKQLRAKQSAEEAAAEEAKASQAAMQEQLNQLLKEKAVATATAKIQPLVGDTDVAGKMAEYLYGAEDLEAALKALGKAWEARENALRREYGKIPAPGAGGMDGPIMTKEQLDGLRYTDRVKFANEHPDEYNRLMGR